MPLGLFVVVKYFFCKEKYHINKILYYWAGLTGQHTQTFWSHPPPHCISPNFDLFRHKLSTIHIYPFLHKIKVKIKLYKFSLMQAFFQGYFRKNKNLSRKPIPRTINLYEARDMFMGSS